MHSQLVHAPQQPACPEHMLDSIAYIIGLTGSQSIQVNYNTCGRMFCTRIFENIARTAEDREHNLTIVLTDTHSSGDSDSYETVKFIGEFSNFKWIMKVYFRQCTHCMQLIAVTTTSL